MKLIVLILPLIFGGFGDALAQSNFYEGRTIRIIVPLGPGGGYDVFARTIARHMGKHIPGNPSLVVENMTARGYHRSGIICSG
jgi:tripartite-type tricarboxylate transporter receptor subunit TctC